jgi:hypothetical protein
LNNGGGNSHCFARMNFLRNGLNTGSVPINSPNQDNNNGLISYPKSAGQSKVSFYQFSYAQQTGQSIKDWYLETIGNIQDYCAAIISRNLTFTNAYGEFDPGVFWDYNSTSQFTVKPFRFRGDFDTIQVNVDFSTYEILWLFLGCLSTGKPNEDLIGINTL